MLLINILLIKIHTAKIFQCAATVMPTKTRLMKKYMNWQCQYILFRYFDEFLSGNFTSEVFVNPYKVRDAAEIVHKLHLIAQELPFNRFAEVFVVIFIRQAFLLLLFGGN